MNQNQKNAMGFLGAGLQRKVTRRTAIVGALGVAAAAVVSNGRADIAAWADPIPTTLTVAPDGSADFLSPKLANASIVGSSAANPYVILVSPGVYTEREWTVAAFTTVRGTSRADCILAGSLPDSATDSQITNNSTVWLKKTAGLENLTITAVNMRYAVHSESSGANAGAVHLIKNCRIEHKGNDGARAWRRANPGAGMSASTVWATDRPWGYGSASGVYERFESCTFVGAREPWYVHTNKDFAAPNVNELVDCELIQTGSLVLPAITVQSLGSGQNDSVTLTNCDVTGLFIREDDRPWITVAPALQVANKAETSITLTDCSVLGYRATHRGMALRISAVDTVNDVQIDFSGDAAPLIVGTPEFRHGGGGVASYAYGYWDISGILVGLANNITVDNTLGRRLGDCAVTPRQLVITLNGTMSYAVDFTENLTAKTNAYVLAIINAALLGDAIATEYLVTAGETYPTFTDRESLLANTGVDGIPRWAAVTMDGAGVRPVVLTDGATAVAGIALEQIGPGRSGRILASGIFRAEQLLGLAGATILNGQPLYLSDAQSGRFSLTGTRQVGAAIADGWMQLA